jgi:hypothetical protein
VTLREMPYGYTKLNLSWTGAAVEAGLFRDDLSVDLDCVEVFFRDPDIVVVFYRKIEMSSILSESSRTFFRAKSGTNIPSAIKTSFG